MTTGRINQVGKVYGGSGHTTTMRSRSRRRFTVLSTDSGTRAINPTGWLASLSLTPLSARISEETVWRATTEKMRRLAGWHKPRG